MHTDCFHMRHRGVPLVLREVVFRPPRMSCIGHEPVTGHLGRVEGEINVLVVEGAPAAVSCEPWSVTDVKD